MYVATIQCLNYRGQRLVSGTSTILKQSHSQQTQNDNVDPKQGNSFIIMQSLTNLALMMSRISNEDIGQL